MTAAPRGYEESSHVAEDDGDRVLWRLGAGVVRENYGHPGRRNHGDGPGSNFPSCIRLIHWSMEVIQWIPTAYNRLSRIATSRNASSIALDMVPIRLSATSTSAPWYCI